MALPQQLQTIRVTGATLGSEVPAKIAALEGAIADILGITVDVNVTESGTAVNNAGVITKALLRMLAVSPVGIRFRTSANNEFRLCINGANIDFDQNTGTEGTPVWTNRLRIALASGNTSILGSLGVTGAVTMLSTLAVTGAVLIGGLAPFTTANDGTGSGLDADKLDGIEAGNTTGLIPVSNGTVNTNLNSDMLDGLHSASFRLGINYCQAADSKGSGVDAGTFTSGSWVTRALAEIYDGNSLMTVVGNQIVLAAGTYECNISAPACAVGAHMIRLYDNTIVSVIIHGSSEIVPAGTVAQGRSWLRYRFTIAAGHALEVQHRCASTRLTDGLGHATGFGANEQYAVAEFWKVG